MRNRILTTVHLPANGIINNTDFLKIPHSAFQVTLYVLLFVLDNGMGSLSPLVANGEKTPITPAVLTNYTTTDDRDEPFMLGTLDQNEAKNMS